MGLLDELLGSLVDQGQLSRGQVGPGQPSQAQVSGLAQAVLAMLNDPRIGGLPGLVQRFQQSGLGGVINSWIGTGQNQPIDPTQLNRAFPDEVTEMSRQAGVPPQQGGSLLAVLLPMLIDRLTPSGQVPQQNQFDQLRAQLLQGLSR